MGSVKKNPKTKKTPLTYIIKFQVLHKSFHNLIPHHSKQLRDRLWSQTTWVYMPGMPLANLGKSIY